MNLLLRTCRVQAHTKIYVMNDSVPCLDCWTATGFLIHRKVYSNMLISESPWNVKGMNLRVIIIRALFD